MDKHRYDSPPSIKPAPPPWLSALPRPHSSSFCENDAQWCGCEPGSSCVHFSSAFLQHVQSHPVARGTRAPVQSLASNNNSSMSNWLRSPVASSAPDTAELLGNDVARDSIMALSISQQQPSHGSADVHRSPACGKGILDLHSDTANSSDLADADAVEQDNRIIRQNARLKADISTHPLYDQLLTAHVACLHIATPVDKLSEIDAQVAQASHVLARYYVLGQNYLLANDEKDELDRFMTHYVLLLRTFKEQLQQHVRDHAVDAVMACRELEQCLLNLTGESPGDGTRKTMSDNDEQDDGESSIYDTGLDCHDTEGFGPLIPTESERSLMERLRQELKSELKTGYKERIVDVREEILRKRRVGKLPGDTTSVLKSWWLSHATWPYPTEDEKAGLVQETGLQLKQINNWFINQRKRNWQSNPSSSAAFKIKRKR